MSAPATITRLTVDRRYTILGQKGLRYLGQTVLSQQHVFQGERGMEIHSDPYLKELMAKGEVRPEGPKDEVR